MQENVKLKCEQCGIDYEKPSVFKKYLVQTKYNQFYKWSLTFCDQCRRKKEINALKCIPDILNILSDSPFNHKINQK